MDSLDTAHVNPNPDPAYLWPFKLLAPPKVVVIGANNVTLQVMEIAPRHRPTSVYVEMTFDGKKICDWLNRDRPCVAIRHLDDSPAVTFTLREVDTANESCKIQVTSNMPQTARPKA